MFIKEEEQTGEWPWKSKNGKVHYRKRTKKVFHFACDHCGGKFTRDTRSYPAKRCNDKYSHFCTNCHGQSALKGQKSRRINLDKRIGEKIIDGSGYVAVYIGKDYPYSDDYGGRIRQHIKVMEEHIGRRLKRIDGTRLRGDSEVVHHIDGDKLNNTLENLDLCTVTEHNKCHATMQYIVFDLFKQGKVVYNREAKRYSLKDN